MLRVKDFSTGYKSNTIIKNFSFDIDDGEILCIIGPNGCGKSTLLKGMIGLLDGSGSILYNDIMINKLKQKERGKLIGLLSQNKFSHFPYTIYETVSMGNFANSKGILRVKQGDKKIIEALKRVDLYKIRNSYIDNISGGQFQRTLIARLFVQNPNVIMLDEPTNHLDLKHQVYILNHLKDLVKELNKIAVVVLHDLNLALKYADKVILMDNEHKMIFGKPGEVLTSSNINSIYGLDVKKWMKDLLNYW